MTSVIRKTIDTVANMFTPDDITRSLQEKEAAVAKLEKASAEANNNYFKAKIVDPAKAETFKQEKLRLDTELSSVRDDITALKQMHEDATRDQRLAARARERATIEARVAKDMAFLEQYKAMAAKIIDGVNHLDETERLVELFRRKRADGEPPIKTAEDSRHAPGVHAMAARRPLAQTVNLPAARNGDPSRQANSLA
jgi:hypothetical protein